MQELSVKKTSLTFVLYCNARTAKQQLEIKGSWTSTKKCTTDNSEKSIHQKEQEKLVHPFAESHRVNGILLQPVSPCAPLETVQSSYNLCCRGSDPQFFPYLAFCKGIKKRNQITLKKKFTNIKHNTNSGFRRKKDGNYSTAYVIPHIPDLCLLQVTHTHKI